MYGQIIEGRWIEIDGTEGVVAVHFDAIFDTQNKKTLNPPRAALVAWYAGIIYSAKVRDGFGARLSASEFWTVFDTEEKAQTFLRKG